MKRTIILLSVIWYSGLSGVSCQDTGGWFSVNEAGPKVWVIGDHGADNIYLVEGADSAMLIDTGLGTADLSGFISRLTSRPLIVVNTHGHPDHSGSNYQFSKVYIHPADSAAARAFNRPEARAASAKSMLRENAPSQEETYKGKVYNTILKPVREGHLFRLGGRTLKVIEAPGHTPGEICLLDIENRLLFTGDNNNTLVWLFLQNCRPLHEYLTTLERQAGMMKEFTTIYPGHGTPLPADFINDQIECVKGILNNSLERKPYESFAGNAMISTYGRASVAFNPDNL